MDFFFLLQQHGTKKREERLLHARYHGFFLSRIILALLSTPLLSGFGFGRAPDVVYDQTYGI